MDWVDLVKAVSVLLVVLMHVISTMPMALGDTGAGAWWGQIAGFLEPLRMPIFFVVSGLLAAGAVDRPWRLTRRRTTGILYLYVVWTAFLVGMFALSSPDPVATVAGLPTTLFFAGTGYWYLLALVIYFAVARLTRDLPALAVITVAALPNLFRPLNHELVSGSASPWTADTLWPALTANLIFFLLGVRFRDLWAAVARIADWGKVATLLVILVVAGVGRAMTPELWEHTFLPLSLGWIVVGIMAAALLTRRAGLPRRFGSYLGTRTLPVFVMQFPLLHLVWWYFDTNPAWDLPLVLQVIYPVALTAALTAAALGTHRALSGTRADVWFTAPAWTVGSPAPTGARPESQATGHPTHRSFAEPERPMVAVTI